MAVTKRSVVKTTPSEQGISSEVRSTGRSQPEHPRALAPGSGPKSTLSLVAWVADDHLDYRSWLREGRRIGSLARGSSWWLGDWLNYGTEKWGERYARAAKVTGYDPKTLRNMRYVASRFDPSLRRDNLTWSHHALLAAMEPDQQTYWLDRASRESFSVDDLRTELRYARKGGEQDEELEVASDERGDPPDSSGNGEAGIGLLCPKCGFQLEAEARSVEL